MSTRLPARSREDLSPEQQTFLDYFRQSVTRSSPHPGAADRASKTLFPVLAVLPTVGKLSVDMLSSLEQQAPSLPANARETACLVTTTFFRSAFAGYAHKLMAVQLGLLSETQAEAITAGTKPGDLDESCSLAYDTAHHLLVVRGALPSELWDRCVKAFEIEGAVALMHMVSLMSWTSMNMNMADVPAPAAPATSPAVGTTNASAS